MQTLECSTESTESRGTPDSRFRRARKFLKDAGRVAWRVQDTPLGKFWAFLFLLGNFSAFEWLMGMARLLGGDRYFILLAVVPSAYLLLSVKADFHFIGHFAENYRWKDRVYFQSLLTRRIPHRRTRKTLSTALVVLGIFLCGAVTYMERLGIFISLTQEELPPRIGRILLYMGTCARIVLTFVGIDFVARWLTGIF